MYACKLFVSSVSNRPVNKVAEKKTKRFAPSKTIFYGPVSDMFGDQSIFVQLYISGLKGKRGWHLCSFYSYLPKINTGKYFIHPLPLASIFASFS